MTLPDAMKSTSVFIAALCLALSVGACGSSPAVRYYALEIDSAAYRQDIDNAPIVVLGPLRMPDYLNRSQMVSRGAGAEMIVDDLHRWAEPLDRALHRTLATSVDGLLDNATVVAYPTEHLLDADFRVTGRVDRFDADMRGLAVLTVQWSISDRDGKLLAAPRRSRYESQASSLNDRGAVAKAMGDALSQFSQDIAQEASTFFGTVPVR